MYEIYRCIESIIKANCNRCIYAWSPIHEYLEKLKDVCIRDDISKSELKKDIQWLEMLAKRYALEHRDMYAERTEEAVRALYTALGIENGE